MVGDRPQYGELAGQGGDAHSSPQPAGGDTSVIKGPGGVAKEESGLQRPPPLDAIIGANVFGEIDNLQNGISARNFDRGADIRSLEEVGQKLLSHRPNYGDGEAGTVVFFASDPRQKGIFLFPYQFVSPGQEAEAFSQSTERDSHEAIQVSVSEELIGKVIKKTHEEQRKVFFIGYAHAHPEGLSPLSPKDILSVAYKQTDSSQQPFSLMSAIVYNDAFMQVAVRTPDTKWRDVSPREIEKACEIYNSHIGELGDWLRQVWENESSSGVPKIEAPIVKRSINSGEYNLDELRKIGEKFRALQEAHPEWYKEMSGNDIRYHLATDAASWIVGRAIARKRGIVLVEYYYDQGDHIARPIN